MIVEGKSGLSLDLYCITASVALLVVKLEIVFVVSESVFIPWIERWTYCVGVTIVFICR